MRHERVFLYRIKDSDDRDCCCYIEPPRFECDHYFSSVQPQGACYSGREFEPYDKIETVLTEEEYIKFLALASGIEDLGFGITKGDERYQKGMALCANLQFVFDKLTSPEGVSFFERIIESEKEYLDDTESLTRDEIDEIFDVYPLEYRDRSIFGGVYEDCEELGEEEAWQLGLLDGHDFAKEYFDYEKFGEDIADDEMHCRLSSGRIVSLMM